MSNTNTENFKWDETLYKDAMAYLACEYGDFWDKIEKFKKLKHTEEDKRIEVTELREASHILGSDKRYFFDIKYAIQPEKLKAVKLAIEGVLNADFINEEAYASMFDNEPTPPTLERQKSKEDICLEIRSGDTVFFDVTIFDGEEKKDVELSGRVRYFYIDRYTVEYFDPIDGLLVKRELELKDLRKQPKEEHKHLFEDTACLSVNDVVDIIRGYCDGTFYINPENWDLPSKASEIITPIIELAKSKINKQ